MAKPLEEIFEDIRNKYRRICPVCGREFNVHRPTHKYCSAECRISVYIKIGKKRKFSKTER